MKLITIVLIFVIIILLSIIAYLMIKSRKQKKITEETYDCVRDIGYSKGVVNGMSKIIQLDKK